MKTMYVTAAIVLSGASPALADVQAIRSPLQTITSTTRVNDHRAAVSAEGANDRRASAKAEGANDRHGAASAEGADDSHAATTARTGTAAAH